MREFNESGQAVNIREQLESLGFHNGVVAHRKADKVEGTIVSVTSTKVTLKVHDQNVTASTSSFLEGKWKAMSEKKELMPVPWTTPNNHEQFELVCMKGLLGVFSCIPSKQAQTLLLIKQEFREKCKTEFFQQCVCCSAMTTWCNTSSC